MAYETAGIGRPPEFTDEQIIQAGLRLESQGDRVNAHRIRLELGGGNTRRIKEIWTDYVKRRSSAASSAIDDLPFELVSRAQMIAESAAREAHKNADTLYRQIYVELNGRLTAQFEDRIQEIEYDLKSAESNVDNFEGELRVMEQENARHINEKRQLSDEIARLEERVAQLKAAAELAREDARSARSEALEMVTSARSAAAEERARSAALEAEIRKLTASRRRDVKSE
jgi:chromosome segregation ATPase